MKNIKKFLIAIMSILYCLVPLNVMAQLIEIDYTFNYQGELIENGVPVTGSYDFTLTTYSSLNSATALSASIHSNVSVNDGLFNLKNVDLNEGAAFNLMDGFELYIEVSVRAVGGGIFTILAPRQALQAVPYANNLTPKGAVAGQTLVFGAEGWVPTDRILSPWNSISSGVYYQNNVGVGTSNPVAKLQVESDDRFPAILYWRR